jgi:hypothetical protein
MDWWGWLLVGGVLFGAIPIFLGRRLKRNSWPEWEPWKDE